MAFSEKLFPTAKTLITEPCTEKTKADNNRIVIKHRVLFINKKLFYIYYTQPDNGINVIIILLKVHFLKIIYNIE